MTNGRFGPVSGVPGEANETYRCSTFLSILLVSHSLLDELMHKSWGGGSNLPQVRVSGRERVSRIGNIAQNRNKDSITPTDCFPRV